ncbi:MAG: hypothetical protein JWM58_2018 [Rhizobium sp.]|nr:hypothetical protein [Rhizobium sp.]
MAALSLLIPVEAHEKRPAVLVEAIASKPDLDIEIVIVPQSKDVADREQLATLAAIDRRVRVVEPEGAPLPTMALWNRAVMAARGEWVTLVRPDDIFEPEVVTVARFAKGKLGSVDAVGWNALQISPSAEPGKSSSVAVPTKYDIMEFDKTDQLKSFYLWEGAGHVPKVPFGLYHGVISRELAESIASTIAVSGREHTLAQWEWTARTVLMGEKFVFCARPLSVINIKPYIVPENPIRHADFPLHAGLGLAAGIAEIQHSVFAEMGALWTGAHENFVRAAIYDCMFETNPDAFNNKCNAYFLALKQWEDGQHASLFKPQFAGERPLDKRRGLHGNVLMIDRHIAGARDAQQFYQVIRNFLVPVGIICGAKAV